MAGRRVHIGQSAPGRTTATTIATQHQPGADQVGEVEARVERRGGRLAVGEQASVRSVASVASTARPIAPPTWTLVLTRPEARPESLGVAPDIASVISDGKPRPAPRPIRTIGGRMSTT